MQEPQNITREYVKNLKKPTTNFLCPLGANSKYKIQFLTFRIRSIEEHSNGAVLFEIQREAEKDEDLFFDGTQFFGRPMYIVSLAPEKWAIFKISRFFFN